MRVHEKTVIYKPGRGPPPRAQLYWHTDLTIPALKTVKYKCLWIKSLSPRLFVVTAQTKTVGYTGLTDINVHVVYGYLLQNSNFKNTKNSKVILNSLCLF